MCGRQGLWKDLRMAGRYGTLEWLVDIGTRRVWG